MNCFDIKGSELFWDINDLMMECLNIPSLGITFYCHLIRNLPRRLLSSLKSILINIKGRQYQERERERESLDSSLHSLILCIQFIFYSFINKDY